MKRLLASVTFVLFAAFVPSAEMDGNRVLAQAVLGRTNATEAEVRIALGNIKAKAIPSEVLAGICNDRRFSDLHRRQCIFGLLRLFVDQEHPDMRLSQLGTLLRQAWWMENKDVSAANVLIGAIPVGMGLKGTIIMVHVFPESERRQSAIFFRFREKISPSAFYQIIRSEARSPSDFDPWIEEIGLLEAGVTDPHPKALANWLKDNQEALKEKPTQNR